MTHNCRVCGIELDDDNWFLSFQKKGDYICKECQSKYVILWNKNNPDKVKAQWTRAHRIQGQLPMNKNKGCATYFGIHVNERLLRHYFNDVEVMPIGNPGYDIVCNHGKKIDGKAGCIMKNRNGWMFNINHNTIADYFFCVAYGNRTDLNILHIWMLPGKKFSHLVTASISPSTIDKWSEYELPIDDVITCCDTMKGE